MGHEHALADLAGVAVEHEVRPPVALAGVARAGERSPGQDVEHEVRPRRSPISSTSSPGVERAVGVALARRCGSPVAP
ncbi:hypothetical protein [Sorangium sp. So ce362]|uniref:hypothetical protein n=1 Tax=Sorangium sp. So ce362 TaxID=3133303 RepID=UPI003F5F209A